jgi:hypothetical protein
MSQVLGAFGLLDFTMLRPVLAWRAFWNLWTTYFFNFQFFFSVRGKPRILIQWIRGHDCTYIQFRYYFRIEESKVSVGRYKHTSSSLTAKSNDHWKRTEDKYYCIPNLVRCSTWCGTNAKGISLLPDWRSKLRVWEHDAPKKHVRVIRRESQRHGWKLSTSEVPCPIPGPATGQADWDNL